jgi:hypothetical protein
VRDILKGVSSVLGDDGLPLRLGGTLSAPRLTFAVDPKKTSEGGAGLLDRIFKK